MGHEGVVGEGNGKGLDEQPQKVSQQGHAHVHHARLGVLVVWGVVVRVVGVKEESCPTWEDVACPTPTARTWQRTHPYLPVHIHARIPTALPLIYKSISGTHTLPSFPTIHRRAALPVAPAPHPQPPPRAHRRHIVVMDQPPAPPPASGPAEGPVTLPASSTSTNNNSRKRPLPAASSSSTPTVPTMHFLPRALNQKGQKGNDGKVLVKLPASSTATSASSSSSTTPLWTRHAHGSYRSYYGARRPGVAATTAAGPSKRDARLAVLQADWFADKEYLDVGTNTGKCAWEIYQAFKPRRMVGVDIDAALIATAQEKLAWASRRDGIAHEATVAFQCEDFVGRELKGATQETTEQDKKEKEERYDVITCLSVTKHIHLQGGDVALRRLLRNIYALLRPGGRFILEPQPWRTYRKRKHASPESLANYLTLQLRPPFKDLLLSDEVGFASVHDLGVPPEAPPGFQRPLFCFTKKEA